MIDSAQLVGRRRSLGLAMLLAMLISGALMLSPQAPKAQAAGCEAGIFCIWSGANYTGGFGQIPCYTPPEGFPIPESWSAKNRCGTWLEIGWKEGGSVNWKACMSPGGERPNPGRFNFWRLRYVAC